MINQTLLAVAKYLDWPATPLDEGGLDAADDDEYEEAARLEGEDREDER